MLRINLRRVAGARFCHTVVGGTSAVHDLPDGRPLDGTTVVRDPSDARRVVEILRNLRGEYHACDTEVSNIDLKKQGPVGNGKVICFSIYCGPDVDFGNGPKLWVDTLGPHADEMFEVWKPYFTDDSLLKVWHNLGFDRHVLYNHGVDVRGFGGDTMHMARLWDAARKLRGGYSLEGLSADLLQRKKVSMKDLFGVPRNALKKRVLALERIERREHT